MPQSEQYLPVFVFPNQLTFYIRDPQSHRQIMTIYNPYDFPVSYEVMSTAPSNYSVQEPQGTLKPRCCIDIAIRRIELQRKGSDEKFRVIIRRRGGRGDAQQGHRDVPSVVFDHRSETELGASTGSSQPNFGSDFRGFMASPSGANLASMGERQGTSSSSSVHGISHQYPLPSAGRSGRPSWLLAIVAVVCIVCLSAPTVGRHAEEDNAGFASYFPEWFHLGVSQKLVAAYVLDSRPSSMARSCQPGQQVQLQTHAVVIASNSPSAVPQSTINRETGTASSRFHIIKIETGPYKRGRWNCRDFDDAASGSGSSAVRSDMIAVGPRSGSSSDSSGRPSFHIIAEENGQAGDHTFLLLATASDHSAALQQTSHHHHHHHGGLATKPPLPTGQHHPHPSSHHPQQHSPLPSTLPTSQQPKSAVQSADSQASSVTANQVASSKGAAISKQPSVTSSQSQATSIPATTTSNSPPLSNIAQNKRSQSPVVPPSTSAPVPPASSASSITVSRFQVRPAAEDLNNAAAAILDSIVGSMHNDNNRIVIGAGNRQQPSPIASSTAGSTAPPAGATAIVTVVDGPVGGGTVTMGQAMPGSVGANVVAIDNKIEQAMDLVKTHLLYAVREEVEVLKEKIIDLEKKVFRLETENKLLREYAPPEILQQIQHQHHPQSQAGATHTNASSAANSQPNSIPSSAPATQQHPMSISQVQQQSASQSSGTITQTAPSLGSQPLAQGSSMVNAPVISQGSAPLSSVQHQPPH